MCFGVRDALVVTDAVRDPSCRGGFERAWPGDRGALKPPIVVPQTSGKLIRSAIGRQLWNYTFATYLRPIPTACRR